jgi:hypothetical protein
MQSPHSRDPLESNGHPDNGSSRNSFSVHAGGMKDFNASDKLPAQSDNSSAYLPLPAPIFTNEDREREKCWHNKVVDLVIRDDTLVEELIHLFFSKVPPYSMMFHTPTFNHRRYTGETVPCLLHIMLALAVRFSDHALLVPYSAGRRKDSKPFPAHLKGEPFAERAKKEVEIWVRSHVDVTTVGRRASAWERTEWAMAMCLIKVYETCLGRARSALYYQGGPLIVIRES